MPDDLVLGMAGYCEAYFWGSMGGERPTVGGCWDSKYGYCEVWYWEGVGAGGIIGPSNTFLDSKLRPIVYILSGPRSPQAQKVPPLQCGKEECRTAGCSGQLDVGEAWWWGGMGAGDS